MASRQEQELQCLQSIRQVTGRLEDKALPEQGREWQYCIRWGDRAILVAMTGYKGFHFVELGVALGQRPISVWLVAGGTRISGLERIATHDPEFDSLFGAYGAPPEAIRAMLDEATRRWLVQTFGGEDPLIATRGEQLTMSIRMQRKSAWSDAEIPGPDAFARWLQLALSMTDALTRAFDERYAAIAQTQGAAAAQAWVEQLRVAKGRGATASNPRGCVIAILVVLLVLSCIAACIAAIMFVG